MISRFNAELATAAATAAVGAVTVSSAPSNSASAGT